MKNRAWILRAGALVLLLIGMLACSKPATDDGRVVKFYQSPMHPWITSDKPGNCTICGMALVPVYEGEKGFETDENLLTLQDVTLRVLGVSMVPAREMELTRTLRFSGIFEDDENRHRVIAAFYDGRIERVYVDHVGEYVEEGQPLAAIYSPELLYVVREYQRAVQMGERSVLETSARRLVQYGLSPEQVEALARQKEPTSTIDLLAPISGTLLTREAYKGQYIKTGEPLFEMGDLSKLWFHAEVYERDLSDVKVGQKAVITTPSVPGREFPGVVTFIDPNFDPGSRSTKVRIEVENPVAGSGEHGRRHLLPHRAYAEATIEAVLGKGLVVPRSAVIRDGRRSVVYVERAPGAFEPRDVKVGRIGDEGVEIVEGLTAGERVVAEGNLMIDAEAQLRGMLARHETTGEPMAAIPGAMEFLAQLARVSEALAAEDAVAAATESKSLVALAGKITPPDSGEIIALVGNLQQLKDVPRGSDLTALRRAFLPWSQAGAELALTMAAHGGETGVRVFECPMTSDSFPGAPGRARWVQTGAETRNPYFGATMLNCGSEVQP